jgi:hypothetical protein
VTPNKGRRGITSLVVAFDRALDPATAQNVGNYLLSLPAQNRRMLHGRPTAARRSRSVGITAAAYDPAHHEVTLTLHTRLRPGQAADLQIKGTSGGVADTSGTALNSPGPQKPGQDYLTTLDLTARHP